MLLSDFDQERKAARADRKHECLDLFVTESFRDAVPEDSPAWVSAELSGFADLMNEDIEFNLDSQARRIAELDPLISAAERRGASAHQGNGWFLSENGDRVDKFIDGNGNPPTRVIDATSGDVTYEFIENGLVKRNIFNSDGDRIGRVTFNEDGTVDQVQFDDSGQQNIRINQDGSYTVDYRTKGESPVEWWKLGEALTSPIGRVSLP